MVTLEQRYNAKKNAFLPTNYATGSIIHPIMTTIAVGSSTLGELKVRRVWRKRWAACRSNRIRQLVFTLPGVIMFVLLLVVSGAGYMGYYCQVSEESPESDKSRHNLLESMRGRSSRGVSVLPETNRSPLGVVSPKTSWQDPLPERVEHHENVGWLLPGVPKMFYMGTGAGESFGPPLTLPTPILVVGMPKTGTTSIRDFFRCNGHNASHWKCATPTMSIDGVQSLQKREKHAKYCAQVIKGNIEHDRPPLQGTGNYQVYAQMDVELPYETVFEGMMRPFACYMPQVNDLETLSASYPSATFILNTRNATRWVHSLRTFLEFDEKLKECDLKGFPAGTGDTDEEFEVFFQKHSQNIRDFVKTHPSHTLIEVNIEDPNAGRQLAEAFGQSAECWVKRNAGAT